MTAKQYRDFPLTALWLIADRYNNDRDRFAVSVEVQRIRRGAYQVDPHYRDVLRKALRQRLEMYGVWGL